MSVINVTENIHHSHQPGQAEIKSNTELYIVLGFLAFLAVMGTAGNALVLYVFSKKKDRLVSTLFILVLAFVDFTTCLIAIPFTIAMEYIKFKVKYDILCKIYQFLITSNIPFSALIMVAIAIDRYFCICHPFFHGLNLERAKYATCGLAIFSVGLGIIVALMYGVYHKVDTTVTRIITESNIKYNNETGTMHIENGISNQTISSGSTDFATVTHIKSSYNFNITEQNSIDSSYEYTGLCNPTDYILSNTFQWYYQKLYYALFVLCLVIVIVLYTLIYKSVLKRRSKRQKQKSKALPLIQNDAITHTSPETMLTVVNGDALSTESLQGANVSPISESRPTLRPPGKCQQKCRKNSLKKAQKQKTAKKDKIRMANLKTAAMLFVVTLVFVVTFLPAFLMALGYVPYNMVVFYLYFANNVANPVIYSFMNKNFREDLRKLFCRRR